VDIDIHWQVYIPDGPVNGSYIYISKGSVHVFGFMVVAEATPMFQTVANMIAEIAQVRSCDGRCVGCAIAVFTR
jgi:hypothetical protein